MRRVLFWMMVVVGIVAIGCGDDDKGTSSSKDKFVGVWQNTDEGWSSDKMILYNDGTVEVIGEGTLRGTWTVEGEKLYIEWSEEAKAEGIVRPEGWVFTYVSGALVGGWDDDNTYRKIE